MKLSEEHPTFHANIVRCLEANLKVLEPLMEADEDNTPSDPDVKDAYIKTLAMLEFLEALPPEYCDDPPRDNAGDIPF